MESGLSIYQIKVFSEIEQVFKTTNLKDIKYNTLKIILLNYFMADIKDIVQRCMESNIKYELVTHSIKPTEYIETISNDDRGVVTDNYLFDMWKNGEKWDYQYLDSNNERVVLERIIHSMQPTTLKVWAKNPITSTKEKNYGVYGDYLDENKYTRHSFFDFILKYGNGILLYVEVKGQQDINSSKTEALRSAYADYFKKATHDLFQQKIVVCLAKVHDDGLIEPEVFYDKNDDTLSKLSENVTFADLIKGIGNL